MIVFALRLIMIMLIVPLLIFGAYFFIGSLDSFATAEQQGEVQSAALFLVVSIIVVEAALFVVQKRLARASKEHR